MDETDKDEAAFDATKTYLTVLSREIYNLSKSENLPVALLLSCVESVVFEEMKKDVTRNVHSKDGVRVVPNLQMIALKCGVERTTLMMRLRKVESLLPFERLRKILKVERKSRLYSEAWIGEWKRYVTSSKESTDASP